jgi:hypothetical protein
MTTLREAAQQALEALEVLDAPPSGVVDHYELERRKQALRAALAQQEQPARAQQMRDAGYTRRPTLREMAQQEREDIAQNLQSRLDAALLLEERRQEIAQPHRETEQEPTVRIKCTVVDNQHPSGVPFEQWVNAPRREWRSLTNEELNRIESQARSHDGLNLSFLFLEIQQALKEKNNG